MATGDLDIQVGGETLTLKKEETAVQAQTASMLVAAPPSVTSPPVTSPPPPATTEAAEGGGGMDGLNVGVIGGVVGAVLVLVVVVGVVVSQAFLFILFYSKVIINTVQTRTTANCGGLLWVQRYPKKMPLKCQFLNVLQYFSPISFLSLKEPSTKK